MSGFEQPKFEIEEQEEQEQSPKAASAELQDEVLERIFSGDTEGAEKWLSKVEDDGEGASANRGAILRDIIESDSGSEEGSYLARYMEGDKNEKAAVIESVLNEVVLGGLQSLLKNSRLNTKKRRRDLLVKKKYENKCVIRRITHLFS